MKLLHKATRKGRRRSSNVAGRTENEKLGALLKRLERSMNLEVGDLENGITKITLSGRLDVEGALKIDGEFNSIAEQKKRVLVDLSTVTFLASLGIRTLITGAKATA